MHGSHRHDAPARAYDSPVVSDYGDLRTITASLHPLVGAADLSFSSPGATPGGTVTDYGGVGGAEGSGGVSDPGGGGGSVGGAGSGVGAGGGGGGGAPDGRLPFTGLAVGAVAGAGSALAAGGAALRRRFRKRS
jgi:hypothetical protein